MLAQLGERAEPPVTHVALWISLVDERHHHGRRAGKPGINGCEPRGGMQGPRMQCGHGAAGRTAPVELDGGASPGSRPAPHSARRIAADTMFWPGVEIRQFPGLKLRGRAPPAASGRTKGGQKLCPRPCAPIWLSRAGSGGASRQYQGGQGNCLPALRHGTAFLQFVRPPPPAAARRRPPPCAVRGGPPLSSSSPRPGPPRPAFWAAAAQGAPAARGSRRRPPGSRAARAVSGAAPLRRRVRRRCPRLASAAAAPPRRRAAARPVHWRGRPSTPCRSHARPRPAPARGAAPPVRRRG